MKEATSDIKSGHLNHLGSDEAIPDSKRITVHFTDENIRQHALQISWINSAAVWHIGRAGLAAPPSIERADQLRLRSIIFGPDAQGVPRLQKGDARSLKCLRQRLRGFISLRCQRRLGHSLLRAPAPEERFISFGLPGTDGLPLFGRD